MPMLSSVNNSDLYLRFISLKERIRTFSLPLKKHGINFFTYSRIYKNNQFIFLCDRDEWYQIKLDNGLFDFNGFVCAEELNINSFTKYVVTGAPKGSIKLLPYMHSMGLWNSIDYYWVAEDYIEITHFGGALHNPNIINFYINNSLYLEYLIFLFRQEFHDILEPPDKALLIPLNDGIPEYDENIMPFESDILENLKNFPLRINQKTYILSRRQAQCLGLALYGKTAKEVARSLNISYRTVEDYISALRQKTGYSQLSSLLAALTADQLSQLMYIAKPNTKTLKFRH